MYSSKGQLYKGSPSAWPYGGSQMNLHRVGSVDHRYFSLAVPSGCHLALNGPASPPPPPPLPPPCCQLQQLPSKYESCDFTSGGMRYASLIGFHNQSGSGVPLGHHHPHFSPQQHLHHLEFEPFPHAVTEWSDSPVYYPSLRSSSAMLDSTGHHEHNHHHSASMRSLSHHNHHHHHHNNHHHPCPHQHHNMQSEQPRLLSNATSCGCVHSPDCEASTTNKANSSSTRPQPPKRLQSLNNNNSSKANGGSGRHYHNITPARHHQNANNNNSTATPTTAAAPLRRPRARRHHTLTDEISLELKRKAQTLKLFSKPLPPPQPESSSDTLKRPSLIVKSQQHQQPSMKPQTTLVKIGQQHQQQPQQPLQMNHRPLRKSATLQINSISSSDLVKRFEGGSFSSVDSGIVSGRTLPSPTSGPSASKKDPKRRLEKRSVSSNGHPPISPTDSSSSNTTGSSPKSEGRSNVNSTVEMSSPQSFTLKSRRVLPILPKTEKISSDGLVSSSSSSGGGRLERLLRKIGRNSNSLNSVQVGVGGGREPKSSVFGIPLETVPTTSVTSHDKSSSKKNCGDILVPEVVYKCTKFIEDQGITDGIYRISGVTSNIKKLKCLFDSGSLLKDGLHDDESSSPLHDLEWISQDVHCVAAVVKLFFRELPTPLFDSTVSELLRRAEAAASRNSDSRYGLDHYRRALYKLSKIRYRTCEFLFGHLSRLCAKDNLEITGMTSKNLAIVWTPNLFENDVLHCSTSVTANVNNNYSFFNNRLNKLVNNKSRNEGFSMSMVNLSSTSDSSILMGGGGDCSPLPLTSSTYGAGGLVHNNQQQSSPNKPSRLTVHTRVVEYLIDNVDWLFEGRSIPSKNKCGSSSSHEYSSNKTTPLNPLKNPIKQKENPSSSSPPDSDKNHYTETKHHPLKKNASVIKIELHPTPSTTIETTHQQPKPSNRTNGVTKETSSLTSQRQNLSKSISVIHENQQEILTTPNGKMEEEEKKAANSDSKKKQPTSPNVIILEPKDFFDVTKAAMDQIVRHNNNTENDCPNNSSRRNPKKKVSEFVSNSHLPFIDGFRLNGGGNSSNGQGPRLRSVYGKASRGPRPHSVDADFIGKLREMGLSSTLY